jgi:hypothetical protein
MRARFFSLRLSERERERLSEIAKDWGCSRSEVLRLCFQLVFPKRKELKEAVDLSAFE